MVLVSLRYQGGEGAGELTLRTVDGWQACRFWSPSPTPATYKYFLPRLKFSNRMRISV